MGDGSGSELETRRMLAHVQAPIQALATMDSLWGVAPLLSRCSLSYPAPMEN